MRVKLYFGKHGQMCPFKECTFSQVWIRKKCNIHIDMHFSYTKCGEKLLIPVNLRHVFEIKFVFSEMCE